MIKSGLAPRLQSMRSPRIAVIGDFMVDKFIWGGTSRVSPEAPVPVVVSNREEMRPGGAGNVVANLQALGASARAFGFLGEDAPGFELLRALEESGAEITLLPSPLGPSPLY